MFFIPVIEQMILVKLYEVEIVVLIAVLWHL